MRHRPHKIQRGASPHALTAAAIRILPVKDLDPGVVQVATPVVSVAMHPTESPFISGDSPPLRPGLDIDNPGKKTVHLFL